MRKEVSWITLISFQILALTTEHSLPIFSDTQLYNMSLDANPQTASLYDQVSTFCTETLNSLVDTAVSAISWVTDMIADCTETVMAYFKEDSEDHTMSKARDSRASIVPASNTSSTVKSLARPKQSRYTGIAAEPTDISVNDPGRTVVPSDVSASSITGSAVNSSYVPSEPSEDLENQSTMFKARDLVTSTIPRSNTYSAVESSFVPPKQSTNTGKTAEPSYVTRINTDSAVNSSDLPPNTYTDNTITSLHDPSKQSEQDYHSQLMKDPTFIQLSSHIDSTLAPIQSNLADSSLEWTWAMWQSQCDTIEPLLKRVGGFWDENTESGQYSQRDRYKAARPLWDKCLSTQSQLEDKRKVIPLTSV